MKSQFPAAAAAIRQWMKSENLAPGTSIPSANILAARFGFSPDVILRAYQILIASGVLSRAGYKLTVAFPARHLTENEETISLVSCGNPPFARLLQRYLARHHIRSRIMLFSFSKNPTFGPFLKKVFAEKPAGIIFWVPGHDDCLESICRGETVPMVVCSGAGRGRPYPSSVQVDVYRGAEMALAHLLELGHRDIAHVTFNRSEEDKYLGECYRAACLKFNLRSSAARVWRISSDAVDPHPFQAIHHSHPQVTAVFSSDEVGLCLSQTLELPKELSVICFSEQPAVLTSNPPLTAVALRDSERLAAWACTELILQLETKESGRLRMPVSHAFFMPELKVRGSTQAISDQQTKTGLSAQPRLPRQNIQETWHNVYPFLKKNRTKSWFELDLSRLANHSMSRHHGWLGNEPLNHFPPGLRSIHGVPFKILDEDRNQGRAVITFRSPQSHTAGKMKLPAGVTIKLGMRVKALYFLHGCGYSRRVAFAEYIMASNTAEHFRVPLIPLGLSQTTVADELPPNLQDWWPGCEHRDFPHAHRAAVFDPSDPSAYERSLYSLEWINPRPNDVITKIEVRVDPHAGPTLALIAVTALLNEN